MQTPLSTNVESAPAQILNIKGMQCPMPLVWARNMMASLKAGEILEVLATDPATIPNFQAFTRASGHELVDWSETGGVTRILMRKSGDRP